MLSLRRRGHSQPGTLNNSLGRGNCFDRCRHNCFCGVCNGFCDDDFFDNFNFSFSFDDRFRVGSQ